MKGMGGGGGMPDRGTGGSGIDGALAAAAGGTMEWEGGGIGRGGTGGTAQKQRNKDYSD